MPFISNVRTFAPQLIGVVLSKLLTLFPNRLISDFNPPVHHHFLDVPVTQRKLVIEPDTIANNFARESMPGVDQQEAANGALQKR
jgi:hypothetical protein